MHSIVTAVLFGRANLASMRAFYLAWPETVRGSRQPQCCNFYSWWPGLRCHGPPTCACFLSRQLLPEHSVKPRRCAKAGRCASLTVRLGSQLYERLALSRDKAALLRKAEDAKAGDVLTPEEAIRDPFVLEFLDLKDEYSQSDLEAALLQRLADFLLELGDDFAFVGRQRRLRIDDTWFRADLVFFHRRLRCLVVIRFSFAGQSTSPSWRRSQPTRMSIETAPASAET